MDVYRIELIDGQWALLKAHGYRPLLIAADQGPLLAHVKALTRGKAAVVRFEAEQGLRELRVGEFDDRASTGLP
jgi:hypothetical protein